MSKQAAVAGAADHEISQPRHRDRSRSRERVGSVAAHGAAAAALSHVPGGIDAARARARGDVRALLEQLGGSVPLPSPMDYCSVLMTASTFRYFDADVDTNVVNNEVIDAVFLDIPVPWVPLCWLERPAHPMAATFSWGYILHFS